MAKIATTITLDADVKKEAQIVLGELGLDLSTAVGLFLRQTAREQRIPFDISLSVPNEETRAALQELKDMEEHPEKYKRYSSFRDALNEVLADA